MKKEVYVTEAVLPPIQEYEDEISDIWESHWLTNMGEKHNLLQYKLREYLDVPNIELLVNGHMALELSLQALHLEGEVITSPFTFASTTHAIVRNGLTPVFCDINPEDYTIDVTKIEQLITERTCAILPVHVYGNICDVERIEEIANKYGLKVIYDAAHTFGVTYKGQGIGRWGDISCFSFHATKVFNTIEGGAVCFREKTIGEKIYQLKNFGIKGPEEVTGIGANAKMNEFCAAMGLCNLRHIDANIAKRKKIAECYDENLKMIHGIAIRKEQVNVKSNYAYYPIVVDEKKLGIDRNMLSNILDKEGIHTRKYFYPLTCDFDCYGDRFRDAIIPHAKYTSDRVLTLPIYSTLEISTVEKICNIIKNAI